jgi:hypothetical protein
MLQLLGEQVVQLQVNLAHHKGKVLNAGNIIEVVDIDDEQAVLIAPYPLLIVLIEVLQILELDVELKIPVTLRDLLHQLWDVCFEVYEQVWRLHEADHGIEDVQVALVVAVIDVAAAVKICRENMCVFIDGPVLDHRFSAVADLADLVEAAVEKVDLQVKGPARHVGVKIPQVGIVINRLEQSRPPVMTCQLVGECTFAGANVARNGQVLDGLHRGKDRHLAQRRQDAKGWIGIAPFG